ncbi:hypothetical protein ACIBI9_49940 [Nonomuraea sp. NPDC050451]|uniref:hypothetical protein n=1 Tax=Nonomuraea sp. NPDC050451 TaxID=3364364 RepID=UPI0037BA5C2B
MNVRLLLVAVPLTLALAACGGTAPKDDGVASADGGTSSARPTASPSASMDPEEAQLKFAQCMREHGIDVPDPQNGQIRVEVPKGVSRDKMDKAQKACQPIMDAVVRDHAPSQQDYDQMVKFAQCMRRQGVDVPDPKPGEGLRIELRNGSKQKIEAAHKACEQYAPGDGKDKRTSGEAP